MGVRDVHRGYDLDFDPWPHGWAKAEGHLCTRSHSEPPGRLPGRGLAPPAAGAKPLPGPKRLPNRGVCGPLGWVVWPEGQIQRASEADVT